MGVAATSAVLPAGGVEAGGVVRLDCMTRANVHVLGELLNCGSCVVAGEPQETVCAKAVEAKQETAKENVTATGSLVYFIGIFFSFGSLDDSQSVAISGQSAYRNSPASVQL